MGNSVLSRLASHAPVMTTVSLPRGRHRLHAMPTTTGYEIRTSPSYDWSGRRRGQIPFTVLQHTIAGAGNLQYERRRYRVKPGDTMLTIVPHDHRYWLEEGGRWEFFWISMSGQEAVRIHRIIQATTGPVFRMRSETIERIAGCCLRLSSRKASSRRRAWASPSIRCGHIWRRAARTSSGGHSAIPPR